MVSIRPCGERIYIKLDPMIDQVKKLFIPDEHKEQTRLATVLVVGPDVKGFKPGDRVIVSWYAGIPISLPQYDLDPVRDRIVTEREIHSFIDGAEGEE
uniref:Putative chaperonin n=1 Tax=viral metagenome TaxID=1070528 RepID=A0A6M3ISB1_9ZZZZ